MSLLSSLLRKGKEASALLTLGLQLNRAKGAIESEGRMYDVRVTLIKGAKALGLGILAVAGASAAAYLSDSAVVTETLKQAGVKEVLIVALVPLIKSAAVMWQNYQKHGHKQL